MTTTLTDTARDRAYDRLRKAMAGKDMAELADALGAYERTGDHNHGPRSLRPGEACPGGNCLVHTARQLLDSAGWDLGCFLTFDEAMHWIAQGVINVAEGHTTIVAGSRVHRAMERLCEMVTAGKVGLVDRERAGTGRPPCEKCGAPVRPEDRIFFCGVLVECAQERLRPCYREDGHAGDHAVRPDYAKLLPGAAECTCCGAMYNPRAGEPTPVCPACRHGMPIVLDAARKVL